jgi:outer membrane receptor for ferrienterochelin and colicins
MKNRACTPLPCRSPLMFMCRKPAAYFPVLPLLVFIATFAVMLTFPAWPAHAEDGASDGAPPADLTILTIEQLMEIEVDTVSGASRYEQPVTEAPASVTIVTAEEIKMFGYRTLADILESVPGFSVINDRNYRYVGIRGFGMPGDYGTRMLLLVDGVRQNDTVYQSGYVGHELVVDIDLVERVEIIRGPGHTLYGANAVLAVINVITRRGRDMNGVEVSGAAGSYDTYKGRLSFGKKFAGGLEMLVSGTYLYSQGQDLYYPEFDAPATNSGWARDCDRERSGSAFLKLAYRDLVLEGGYVKRDKAIPTAPWGTVFNDSGTETTDSSLFLDLKYQRTFDNGLDVMGRFSWNQYNYDGYYRYNDAGEGEAPLLYTNVDKIRNSWIAGEVQLTKELGERHKIVAGVEFRDALRMDQMNYDTEVNLDDRRTTWNTGVYLQDEYQVFDSLALNVGVRYDHFDTFGDTVNPRVALIYSPFSHTTLKFLFGTAFRPPNGYELYYGDGATQKANTDLKEERSTNYELILEQSLGRHFRGTVSGYYTRVKDLIVLTTDPADEMMLFRNIGKVESKGVELLLDGKWDNGIRGRISYAFQDARDVAADEWLVNSARHLAKLHLLFPLVREKVFFGVEEQYTSRKKTGSGGRTGDFFVTNLTLSTRNLLHDFELSASVYNLFNTGYHVPASEEHVQESIRQDGRSFRVKATWRF